jgi:hypothetical protein
MWRDPGTGQFNAESSLGGRVSSGRIATATIPGTSTLGLFYRNDSDALACNFGPVNGPWTGEINRGFALTSDITPAASPEAGAPRQPGPGLRSNSNYQMVGIQSPGPEPPSPLIGWVWGAGRSSRLTAVVLAWDSAAVAPGLLMVAGIG